MQEVGGIRGSSRLAEQRAVSGPPTSDDGNQPERHAHGDQYKATDFKVPGAGTLTMTYTPADGGEPIEVEDDRYPADGRIAMGMYNYADSITDFPTAS